MDGLFETESETSDKEAEKYKCAICQKIYINNTELIQHMEPCDIEENKESEEDRENVSCPYCQNNSKEVWCTVRSWQHEISALIMTLSPGLENNYTLERSSKSFPGFTRMSGFLENCLKYIPKSQCSPIQETMS